MKLRNTIQVLVVLPLATTLACGAADGTTALDESTLAEEAVSEADTTIVASADVGYGTVHFHEQLNEDGTFAVAVSEERPANYESTPLTQLFEQGHTNLEVFMALLPDAEPPQSFVDAHAVQAADLGRETDELRVAVFDANAPIQKSVAWCRGIATPDRSFEWEYTYSNRMSKDDVRGAQSLTLNAGKAAVAPAICNESSASKTKNDTVQGRVLMKKNGGSYDNPGWTQKLAPGHAWQWHGLALMEYPPCNQLICLPRAVDASYQLQGRSNTTGSNNRYDLYIAKIASSKFIGVIK